MGNSKKKTCGPEGPLPLNSHILYGMRNCLDRCGISGRKVDDPIGFQTLRDDMRHENDPAVLLAVLQRIGNELGVQLIQRRKRLIKEKEGTLSQKCSCKSEAVSLPLA